MAHCLHYFPCEPGITGCKGDARMLWTIAVILAVLWFLGMVTSYTLSGFIHVLLFLAIAMILIRLVQGRRVL